MANCWFAEARSPKAPLVRRVPRQRAQEIRTPGRAKKFVVLDHGCGSDSQRGQRRFHADHTRREAHAHRVGQCDVRWEGESDFTAGSSLKWLIEVEKNSTGAHVLSLGMEFVFLIETNDCWQAHVEAPHHPPFFRARLHPWCAFRKHVLPITDQGSTESTFRLGMPGARRPTAGPSSPSNV